MSNSRELVDAITTGNNVEAERIFQDNMASRVGDKLEMQRREVANSFVKSAIELEDQEVDIDETD
tara:strand:- start:41 stop:235 length:195 start_codon:yes stop_codon:yes gene_type:complete